MIRPLSAISSVEYRRQDDETVYVISNNIICSRAYRSLLTTTFINN